MERAFFMITERLGFSTWEKKDDELAGLLWGDPAVTRYICAPGIFSPRQIRQRLDQERELQQEHGFQEWPVFDRESGDLAGCCGLRPHPSGRAQPGINLRPAFWGRGLAQEAAQAVIGFAFSILRLPGLQAGHHPNNQASRALLEKLGFTYIGAEPYAPIGLEHPAYILTLAGALQQGLLLSAG